MKHIKWPSIEQFRNVVKNVQHKTQFVGVAEDCSVIVNRQAVMPKLSFEGTTKLHGTNAAVGVMPDGEVWFQSRENIITPEKDNAGFAMFAVGKTEFWRDLACSASVAADLDPTKPMMVFGEWCGQGIQKGVAISELPKMFVIFGMALAYEDGTKRYLTRAELQKALVSYNMTDSVKCIYDFPSYSIDIDFENPHEAQNKLNEITESVEAECPVGKALGVSGIGEGVVWRCIDEGYEDSGFWFKVKGEKHSKSKVKTLATVDIEKMNSIQELAERLANHGRVEQMAQQVFDTLNGGEIDIKKTGELTKAVMQDIFKEDVDIVSASGFSGKELNGPVAKICRDYIMSNT